jgi:hypothetical protein
MFFGYDMSRIVWKLTTIGVYACTKDWCTSLDYKQGILIDLQTCHSHTSPEDYELGSSALAPSKTRRVARKPPESECLAANS